MPLFVKRDFGVAVLARHETLISCFRNILILDLFSKYSTLSNMYMLKDGKFKKLPNWVIAKNLAP